MTSKEQQQLEEEKQVIPDLHEQKTDKITNMSGSNEDGDAVGTTLDEAAKEVENFVDLSPTKLENLEETTAAAVAIEPQQQPQFSLPKKSTTMDANKIQIQPQLSFSSSSTTTPAILLDIPYTHNTVKIIKGEIHNVLNVMRADIRYASPMRFVQEMTALHEHPLTQSLRELHEKLSLLELTCGSMKHSSGDNNNNYFGGGIGVAGGVDNHHPHHHGNYHPPQPDLVWYITPFCSAISGRDVSASITGAALSALHKFLLYNFLSPDIPGAKEGMTLIAKSVLHCTFEETPLSSSSSATTKHHMSGRTKGASSLVTPTKSGIMSSSSSSKQLRVMAQVEDEQVVLKLLNLSALIVRCSLAHIVASNTPTATTMATTTTASNTGTPMNFKQQQQQLTEPLLDASLICGLLDTCLHVSHRAQDASALLKSAAGDALGQILLVVFGTKTTPTTTENEKNNKSEGKKEDFTSSSAEMVLQEARASILRKLASLINPLDHSDATCVTSLTLVNIALETMRHTPSQDEITILQNDVCKYLLQRSTTRDLTILSLTLRVIFNLFQTIRNHLKVPLEVFLTSVHLRILTGGISGSSGGSGDTTAVTNSSTNEQREVALESLLEFCQEPALMQDLYLNYDCDVHCTNLFEAICTALAKVVEVGDEEEEDDGNNYESNELSGSTSPPPSGGGPGGGAPASPTTAGGGGAPPPPLNALNRLAIEGILAVIDSIARRCQTSTDSGGSPRRLPPPPLSETSSILSDSDTDSELGYQADHGSLENNTSSTAWETASSVEAQMVLQQRKRKKLWMATVASEFNRKPVGKEWVQIAQQSNLLPTPITADAVAHFLFSTPNLDKTQMGIYLSQGPASKYPFHEQVRTAFVSLFDFEGMAFSEALRKFLLRFRLPGEAQCIDRLMEAFSIRLYEQQKEGNMSPFKSADGAFVLAFSTIMLNTDLHNPTIKDERRMTLGQFIRNNRGINDGEDLPLEFLTDLYTKIKENEIQVKKELSDVVHRNSMEGREIHSSQWDGLLSKSDQVSKPFFTPADAARRTVFQAGVHERDMFLAISKSATRCISSVFSRTFDDVLVVKALKGFRQMVKICVYFDLDETLNDIFTILLDHGRDYIMNCIVLNYADYHDGIGNNGEPDDDWDEEYDAEPQLLKESPIPDLSAASKLTEADEAMRHYFSHHELRGCAAHRGLLALDCAFSLIRAEKSRLREAWPTLIECLCALRDASALPIGLADLDDFADSRGNMLQPSPFARQSQKRLDDFYRSLSGLDDGRSQSWLKFPSFFTKDSSSLGEPYDVQERMAAREPSPLSRALLSVTETADLEQVVLMRPDNLPLAMQTIRALLDTIDAHPYLEDPVFEHHAVFSLELAARAFFANRDRAAEIFPMFYAKFQAVLAPSTTDPSHTESLHTLPSPFLTERIVVTILRACIHLYDIEEVRPSLRSSLDLLMNLSPKLVRCISNRFACGMAIILRGSFYTFETSEDWNFMGDMLDMLAHFGPGRGFVFDGIASTVEYALPSKPPSGGLPIRSREVLTADGSLVFCRLLTRYVMGEYEKDLSLSVPAILCLEKVYVHMATLKQSTEDSDVEKDISVSLRKDIAVSFFKVCCVNDPDSSQQALRCFQNFLHCTQVQSMSDKNWIDILAVLVSNKQPSTEFEASRANTLTIILKTLLKTFPSSSSSRENWDDLSDIINRIAGLIRENLRGGRRGTERSLFERTVDITTQTVNEIVEDDFGGEEEYCKWTSETLVVELENVGASGGTFKQLAAITKGSN